MGGHALHFIELLKDPAKLLLRDTNPGIRDSHPCAKIRGLQNNLDASLIRSKADSVEEKIAQNLANPLRITSDLLLFSSSLSRELLVALLKERLCLRYRFTN